MLQSPPRNIVLFSDGTGNSSSSVFKTNVRRLYEALDLTDPLPPTIPRQLAFYDDGVGTSAFRPLAVLGGAFGYGLARNVRTIYAFLCRTYRPGDRIYGFGFSRGSFTIRLVVGLILDQGLVRYDGNEATLARDVADAYRAYRSKFQNPAAVAHGEPVRHGGGGTPLPAKAFRGARDAALSAWRRFRRQPRYDKANNVPPGALEVKMLGVWDTVDAYGLPIEELTRAVDRYVWPLSFPTADLKVAVGRAYQALCLDDERNTFFPRLWNEQQPSDAQRITQVWFAGVHADVGGGYGDGSLSYVSLDWMTEQAEANGLHFSPALRAQQSALADDNGPKHDSRRGFAGYYRYKPRDLRALTRQSGIARFRPKVHVARPLVHESVFRRIKDGQDGYAPIGLPPAYGVVTKVDGKPAIIDSEEFLWRTLPGPERQERQRQLDAWQDDVWNWVWRRSLAYYFTLFATLLLLATPLFLTAKGCSSVGCFLSPIIVGAGGVLPGYASTWLSVMAANPLTTVTILAAIVLGLVWGSRLETRISDTMRQGWYRLVPDWAPHLQNAPATQPGGRPLDRIIEQLRRFAGSPAYQWIVWRLLPGSALAVTLFLAIGLTSSGLVSVLEAGGAVCRAGHRAPLALGSAALDADFHTNEICHPLNVGDAVEGARYRLRIVTAPSKQAFGWHDADLPASPNGVAPGRTAALMPFVPFRRHIAQPWFKLMVRIGVRGTDTYAPEWRLVDRGDRGDTYVADFTARRSGQIFVYVNDALPLFFRDVFYRNNDGTGAITVTMRSLARELTKR